MTETNSDNNEPEEKPIEFLKQRDVFGFEKPTINIDNEQTYTMKPKTEQTSQNTTLINLKDIDPANNWDRLLAGIIDFLIIIIFHSILYHFLFSGQTLEEINNNKISKYLDLLFISLYHGFFDSSAWQGTFGKKIMGIKIIHESGNRISFLRSIGRYLGSGISMLVFLLGYISIFRNTNRQAWHDMMVGTYVIKEKKSESLSDKKVLSKKRIFGLALIFLLLIILGFIFVNMSNQLLNSKLKEIESKEKQTLITQIAEEINSSEVSKSDFIYKDPINKFQILMKKGFNQITNIPKVQFLATNGDTSDLSLTSYMITSGEAEKPPTPGQFLVDLQKSKPQYKFSKIKVTNYKNGYKIEEGKVEIHKDNPTFGTIRIYIKDKKIYQLLVTHPKEEPTNESKRAEEIFNSFDILE